MSFVMGNLALWVFVVVVVFLFLRGTGGFSIVGPVLGVCMIGSTSLMRRASLTGRDGLLACRGAGSEDP